MPVLEKLKELGLTLPEPPKPVAAYVPAVRTGDLIFVSGQIPLVDGKLFVKGPVISKVSLEKAQEAARTAALNSLAVIASMVDLEDVVQVVKLTGFVASDRDFLDQPKVINGASLMLTYVFGEAGRHARSAIGVLALPMWSPVEVELIVQVKPLKG